MYLFLAALYDTASDQLKAGWNVGPFHLTNDVSLGTLISIITIIAIGVKFVQHTTRVEDQVTKMWKAIMGEGPMDDKALVNQFKDVQYKVNEMWQRLSFGNMRKSDD